jgi:hypothetical protein
VQQCRLPLLGNPDRACANGMLQEIVEGLPEREEDSAGRQVVLKLAAALLPVGALPSEGSGRPAACGGTA